MIVEYVEALARVCWNRYSHAVYRQPSGRLSRAHTGARGAMPESCLGDRPGDRTLPPSPPHTCLLLVASARLILHSLLHIDCVRFIRTGRLLDTTLFLLQNQKIFHIKLIQLKERRRKPFIPSPNTVSIKKIALFRNIFLEIIKKWHVILENLYQYEQT